MMFLNFALRYHKDIDHWVIYHLKVFARYAEEASITFHELISILVLL